MCSGTAKQVLFDRFSASGKDALILLIASDLDPAGDHIAQNFVNYMIRDAGLDEEQVEAWKVALMMEQVRWLGGGGLRCVRGLQQLVECMHGHALRIVRAWPCSAYS